MSGSTVLGVQWVLTSPEQVEAFKEDWLLGMPLREMAALHGYRNVNGVSRAAQRLGLPKRSGGPRNGCCSPGSLTGGSWQRRGLVQVWVES